MTKTKLAVVPPSDLEPAEPPRTYNVEATLALPAFWRGAVRTRAAYPDGAGFDRCLDMIAGIAAGTPLNEIAAYRDWLGPR